MGKPNREAESVASAKPSHSIPRRTEIIAESHLLMRRSTWCGMVFGLGVLITSLNLLPPVAVRYGVVSEVVVSESRLGSLQSLVTEPSSDSETAMISSVKILDRGAKGQQDGKHAGEKLVLVEVRSEWAEKCEEDAYTSWLEGLTRAGEGQLTETMAARMARIARWELAAAEHYASQHAFLASNANIPSNSGRRTFQLTSSPSNTLTSPAGNATAEDELGGQLLADVSAAKQNLKETELAWQQQIEQSSGALRITGAPEVAPITSRIPLWMAASVLILGLASGSSAGWFQYRLQSGGAFDPRSVARQLELAGVPMSGKVELTGENLDRTDWLDVASRSAGEASRRSARHMTGIGECLLGFWFALVLFRLLLDPLWRGVLIDSPLAAFGRLLMGMP